MSPALKPPSCQSPNHRQPTGQTPNGTDHVPPGSWFGGILRSLAALLSAETVQKSLLSALDQGVISLGNFLASILLAHYLAPTELGIYAVGFILIYLMRAVQEGAVTQPLNALGAVLDGEDFRTYASATGILQLILGGLSAALAAGLGWFFIRQGNDLVGRMLLVLCFTFPAWQSWEFIRRVFYTQARVGSALIITIISNGARLGIILWLGSQDRLIGITGLTAIAWGSLAALLPGMILSRRYWTLKSLHLGSVCRRNWVFGRWILGGTIANWVTLQLYPILTASLINFAAAGAYQALQNLVAPVHVLLRATDTFLTPRISKIFHQQGRDRLKRTLALTYLIVGIPISTLLAGAVIFVEPLLRLIRDESYLPYKDGIFIMAAFYALWYAYSPLQTAFKAIRRSLPIFLANAAAVFSMFLAGTWAIQRWGLYGTIAGQAVNALIINLVLWGFWIKIMGRLKAYPADHGDMS